MRSRIFVPILSRGAINDAKSTRQNFALLTKDSVCDNVLLEHRLALELRDRKLIEKIYPIMIGDYEDMTQSYSNYFASGCVSFEPIF